MKHIKIQENCPNCNYNSNLKTDNGITLPGQKCERLILSLHIEINNQLKLFD